jgi:hypothetical protein
LSDDDAQRLYQQRISVLDRVHASSDSFADPQLARAIELLSART